MWAAAVAVLSVLLGLGASYLWDAPASPAIVLAATLLFVAGLVADGLKRRRSEPVLR